MREPGERRHPSLHGELTRDWGVLSGLISKKMSLGLSTLPLQNDVGGDLPTLSLCSTCLCPSDGTGDPLPFVCRTGWDVCHGNTGLVLGVWE